jgi:hypothetical protein
MRDLSSLEMRFIFLVDLVLAVGLVESEEQVLCSEPVIVDLCVLKGGSSSASEEGVRLGMSMSPDA